MALVKGLEATVYTGGTSTAATGEATTELVSGSVYQIASAAKQVLDGAHVPVVKGNAVVCDPQPTVNYLEGKFTFASPPDEPVTADIYYIPMLAVAKCRGMSLDPSPETADVAVFGDTAPRTMMVRSQCKVSIESIESPDTDLDSGGGTVKIGAILLAGTAIFIEAAPSSVLKCRGWFVPKGTIKAELTDVVVTSIELEAVLKDGVSLVVINA